MVNEKLDCRHIGKNSGPQTAEYYKNCKILIAIGNAVRAKELKLH